MTFINGWNMNWITHNASRLVLPAALFSLLVLAADIPDALPAGFLEQLPTLLQMRDDEYEALLQFMQQNEAAEAAPATPDNPLDPAIAEEQTDESR